MNRLDPVMIDSLRKAEVNLEDRRGKEFELLNLAQVSPSDRPTSHPCEPLRSESHGRCQQATAAIHGDRGTSSPTLAGSDGALPLHVIRPITFLAYNLVRGAQVTSTASQTEDEATPILYRNLNGRGGC